jgi:hypothetical protein
MAAEMKKDTVFPFETLLPTYHTTLFYDVEKYEPSANKHNLANNIGIVGMGQNTSFVRKVLRLSL